MIIFFIYFFRWKKNCFIKLCEFQVYSRVIFQIVFHYRLLQEVEYIRTTPCVVHRSLLFILHIVLCMCWSQTPDLSPYLPFWVQRLENKGQQWQFHSRAGKAGFPLLLPFCSVQAFTHIGRATFYSVQQFKCQFHPVTPSRILSEIAACSEHHLT